MIEATTNKRGFPKARCVCDDCGAETFESAKVDRSAGSVSVGQVVSKLSAHGWSYVKRVLRCPDCETKRKETTTMKDAVEAVREPSKEQKREIIAMLRDVYDTENERYMQGDTDETVASVLEVMPGWVAQLREELFGPAGSNEDMEALAVELAALRDEVLDNIGAGKEMVDRLTKNLERLKGTEDALAKIKTAVGARVCRKAGVK